ncbi:DUF3298 domain-containing protein [Mergibacter septicus]|uniref:RsiV family protein n=1 Tax=Mergibacter septicus TaxID=221402 RepID=UPI0011797E68|nr:RsiV family protein [Mergibacter septicus]AWX13146.1 DUF3298 domain-containing protein [Mergibacter septicus]
MLKKWRQTIIFFMILVGSAISTKVFAIPLLKVETQPIIQAQKCLKAEQQACYQVDIQTIKTNIEWINHYFEEAIRKQLKLDEVAVIPENWSEKDQKNLSLAELKQNYLADLSGLMQQEFAPFGYFQFYRPRFFAQNQALAMFVEDFYLFSGGAHGYGSTNYLNFDLKLGKKLTVDDLLLSDQKDGLLEKLSQAYAQYLSTKAEDNSSEGYSVDIIDNFTFTADSLVFSYPPYYLGSYAEGTIVLSIPYTELIGILKPAYLFGTTQIRSDFL